MLCPGPHAVSQGVPPFNDRAAPPVSKPGLPKAGPPLAPVVLCLGRRRQIRGHGVGDLVVHFGTVGLEVNRSDERVVRQVGVEQGAVVVVGASTWWCLRPVRGRCLQDDCGRLRAGLRICCAGSRIHAHEGDADHYQRRKRPRHHRNHESPRSLLAHSPRLPPGQATTAVHGAGPEDAPGPGPHADRGYPRIESRARSRSLSHARDPSSRVTVSGAGAVRTGSEVRRVVRSRTLAEKRRPSPPVAVGAEHDGTSRRSAARRHDAVGHVAVGRHAHRATGAHAGVHELAHGAGHEVGGLRSGNAR